MLGMGATLGVGDFVEVARERWSLTIGLLCQLVLAPLIALAVIHAFALSPGWAVGIALVACVPGGTISNLLTYLGRGNTALSIALTLTATLGCAVTVPLALGVLAGPFLPVDFAVPMGRMARDIFLFLLLPLGFGMAVYRLLPGHAKAASTWSVRIALALLVVLTVSSLGTGRIDLGAYGLGPPLIIILFANLLLMVGVQLMRFTGRYDDDAVSVGVEMVVRNVGVGLLLMHFFFPGQPEQTEVLFTCLFYAGASWVVAGPLIWRHRKRGTVWAFGRSRRRA